MKITRIVATEVVVPAKEGHVDRPEFGPSLFDKKPKWMLEVFTDDGLVGYGESGAGISAESLRRSGKTIIGKEVLSLPRWAPLPPDLSENDGIHPDPPVPYRFHEMDPATLAPKGSSAFEIALSDLWGKKLGAPLHALLGGAVREWVPTSWWFGRSDPEHAARQMEIGLRHGFTTAKFKATAEDDIVGIVRAIKSVAGEAAMVVVDANHRFYRLSETLAIAKGLEEFENVILEDPFPFDVYEWQLFRKKSRLPLAFHNGDFVAAVGERCCDYVNLKSHSAWHFLGQAYLAWRFGLLCWHATNLNLGIIDAYFIHCSAVARSCVLPGDCMGHRIRCDDLIEEELEVRDGAIRVPAGPGLGVTLDQEALQRFARERWELTA